MILGGSALGSTPIGGVSQSDISLKTDFYYSLLLSEVGALQKNVASQKWTVFAFNRIDLTPKTGDAGNITANLRIDGGVANAVDDVNPTELEDGYYVFDITQVETNGDLLLISPESTTSDIQVIGVPGVVYTVPPNFSSLGIESGGAISNLNGHTVQTGDSYSRLGSPAAASIAADLLVIDNFVDELESRLTAARAGYIDNINGHTAQTGDNYARIGATGSGLTTLAQASIVTEGRLSELDAITGGKMANQVDIIESDTTSLNDTKIPDTISLANINSQVDTALTDYDSPTRTEATSDKDAIITEVNANETKIDTIDTNVDAILVDTTSLNDTKIPDIISLANINAQVDTALTDYDGPTRAEATSDKNEIISDTDNIQTRLPASLIAGRIDADTTAISGDSVAADNLESTYDNTGYSSDVAPATQAQVGNIGSASGGAINFEASTDNTIIDTIDNAAAVDKGGGLVGIPVTGHLFATDSEITIAGSINYNNAYLIISQTVNEVVITETYNAETFTGAETIAASIKGVVFVGVETANDYTATEAEDGIHHNLDDTDNEIDIIYKFNIGGARKGIEVLFKGYLNGGNDSLNIQAYDFNGANWGTRLVLDGQVGSSNKTESITLLSKHTGTGNDSGIVLIRIHDSAQSNPSLFIDELLVSAVNTSQTVGYADGRIWVDTINGVVGTESFVNGTGDNPVLTWADALTLSSNLNIRRFHIAAGSAITLTANSDNYNIEGQEYSLALGGQSIASTYIFGATVTGIGIGGSTVFEDCPIGTVTLPPSIMRRCYLFGTITNSAVGDWFINHCMSRTAGSIPSVFNYGAVIGNTNLNMRLWSGDIQLEAMGDTGTDTAHIEGFGKIVEGTCTGGVLTSSGNFTVSGITNLTLNDDARIDIAQINAQADSALVDYDGPTRAEATSDKDAIITDLDDIKGTGFTKDVDSLTDILTDVTGLNGSVMRGTDSASLASVCTEGRLAELDAANIPADVDSILEDTGTTLDGKINTIDSLIDAIKLITDALPDSGALTTIITDIDDVKGTDFVKDTHSLKQILDDVTGLNGDVMRGTDSANTDKTGYSLSTAGILSIWHQALTAVVTSGSVGKLLKDEITSVRMATLTDWINGGRLDLLLDAIKTVTDNLPDSGNLTTLIDHLTDIKGATFSGVTDSLEAIRDRGDAEWVTGAGGSDRLLMVDTTIATLTSQTVFTLTAGSSDDDAYNNCTIVIEDVSTAIQKAKGLIFAYVGSTKEVTLKYDPAIFTMAVTDKIYILAETSLKSTEANRQLNVASDGDIAGNIDGSVNSVVGHTPQTGDSYAVVNHGSYGNDKLVRATTPANTLDVDVSGDVTSENMRGTDDALLASSAPTNFGDLAITSSTGKTTVGTNDDKTGYSISGSKTTLDALNDVSTAQVNAEVDTALSDYDGPTRAESTSDINSVLARLGDFAGTGLNTIKGFFQAMFRKDGGVSGGNLPSEINEIENTITGTYDATTDSQEATRDTAPLGTSMRGTDSASLASVCTEDRLSELDSANLPADVDAILEDTNTTLDNHLTDIKGTGFTKDVDSLTDILTDVTGLNGSVMRGTDDAALATQLEETEDMIEFLREHHTHTGNKWYVDPVNGNDSTGDGSKVSPYLTVTKAHTEAVDNNHDLIILVPGSLAGVTTLDEQVTITKNYLFIRGPGRDFLWKPTSPGDVITVSGNGVELSGFRLETHTSGNGRGISCTGDFLLAKHLYSDYTRGAAIYLNNASECIINDVRFSNVGQSGSGDCIEIEATGGGSCNNNSIIHSRLLDASGDGISLNIISGSISDTRIHGNIIHASSAYGIDIGSGVMDTFINYNFMRDNISGNINNNGTDTYEENNEQWAKGSIATEGRLSELDSANLPADVDSTLEDTNELQTDWTNAGRLDTILDELTTQGDTNESKIDIIDSNVDDIVVDTGTTLENHLTDIKGTGFIKDTHSLPQCITAVTDAILNIQPVIPSSIDLADTVTSRLGLLLINSVDDLPSTAEITPGIIDIDRKAIGDTSWSSIVSAAACSEQAGMVYYDEVFDTGTGYVEGDSIRITFKNQKITVSGNDHEITDSNGVSFQTEIRQTMRGTDDASLASVCTEGRLSELDSGNIPADVSAVKSVVDAVLVDTGTTIPSQLTTIDNVVDAIDTLTQASGDGDLAAVKSRLDIVGIVRNVAYSKFPILMRSATDHVTGTPSLTVTVLIQKDGGSWVASTNSIVDEEKGMYSLNLTATEMNAKTITLEATAVGADPTRATIITT